MHTPPLSPSPPPPIHALSPSLCCSLALQGNELVIFMMKPCSQLPPLSLPLISLPYKNGTDLIGSTYVVICQPIYLPIHQTAGRVMAPSTFLCGTVGKPRLFGSQIKNGNRHPRLRLRTCNESRVVAIQTGLGGRAAKAKCCGSTSYESPDAAGSFCVCS